MANIQAPSRAVPARRRGLLGLTRLERNEALWFYLLISPWLIGFLALAHRPDPRKLLPELHPLRHGKPGGLDRARATTRR